MASTTKLNMKFMTSDGKKTFGLNYANNEAYASEVKALMNGMIANGSIYKYPPLSIDSAEFVTQTRDAIDIDD